MGIPCLQEGYPMLDHDRPQAIEFMGAKTGRFRKIDGIEPKLHDAVAVLDLNVRRFRFFQAVEEETEA
jgi:hypothetical protein